VVQTFVDQGYPREKLVRHQYGYDPQDYYSDSSSAEDKNHGLTMLFAGDCAVRKGVHLALEAWLNSPAHRNGKFQIAGRFLPAYAEKLAPMLAHPSVEVLGFRNDVPELMRKSDLFVLPSIEEGSALVTSDARGSGCVLLVSEAAGAICKHMENALVHRVGDIARVSPDVRRHCPRGNPPRRGSPAAGVRGWLKVQSYTDPPENLLHNFNPSERLHRQFNELVDYTQMLVRRSPEQRVKFWSTADASSPERWKESTRFEVVIRDGAVVVEPVTVAARLIDTAVA
jgi:glycosyltransferase involved in cell wall biosynthesis